MKNLIYGLIGLAALAVTTIGGFLGWNDRQQDTYKIGDTVEDFSLDNLENVSVSLSAIAGSSGTILVFTFNTCPYSKLYENRILQLEDVYGDAGYPLIIINPNDPNLKPGDQPQELLKWTREKNYTGVYLIDRKGLFHRFEANKTPEVFLLDSEKKLRYRGAIDNGAQGYESVTRKYLEDAIKALENGQEPDPAETRPVGCVIKAN